MEYQKTNKKGISEFDWKRFLELSHRHIINTSYFIYKNTK